MLLNISISAMMMNTSYANYGVGFYFKLLWKVVCVFIIYLVFFYSLKPLNGHLRVLVQNIPSSLLVIVNYFY